MHKDQDPVHADQIHNLEKIEKYISAEDHNKKRGHYMVQLIPFGRRGPESGFGDLSFLAIMAEAEENQAMSITNNVENVATAVMRDFRFQETGRIIWIEYMPERKFTYRTEPESFDLVTFKWKRDHYRNLVAYAPNWKRVDREWIEALASGRGIDFSYKVN